MTTPPTDKDCRYCNGTGYRTEVAHVDDGRCWHCNGVDTSYTMHLETPEVLDARLKAERAAARLVAKA